jgi:membrane associated rhomboid family serine protease
MGLAEREYQRSGTGGGYMSRLTPVVKWLLIANVALFFLDYLILPLALDLNVGAHNPPPIVRWGTFTIVSAIFDFQIWKFITFQFLHGHFLHMLFNCIGLYFFGPWMERWWGSGKFAIFYLLCGAAGAVFFTLLMFLNILPGGLESGLIGASAGIYGIFIGVAVIAPDLRVMLLFPPIELSMRQLAIAVLAIASGAIVLRLGGNEGGEAGHLGGAILGFILVRYPGLLGMAAEARPLRQKRSYEPKLRPRSDVLKQRDNAVDLILDKISREGFQSLTADEREVLRKASEKHNSE